MLRPYRRHAFPPQGRAVAKPLRGHLNNVMGVDVSPRGNLIASASFDESARLWDVRSGRCVRAIPAHSEPVTSARFNSDGTVVVTGSYDGLMCARGARGSGGRPARYGIREAAAEWPPRGLCPPCVCSVA